ncbi:malonate decarboxylase holo-ACP synthase [Paraburkholderia sp. BCC1885]|uniref:malonate decarboxylase holo-ACP synthase n=1 Tax=Paraburkholderia sp. BCC1885 TaxID=2562669 RepID=UPI00118443A9|nr:malonate decarboxylase holo-ACP synthase [Paraburkholderia sp. BCC1885]
MPTCAAPPFAPGSELQCDARWRPHDLLRLRRLPSFDGEPEWVRGAFSTAPFVVVRRAQTAAGVVPIGVRGNGRAQRHGTWAEAGDVETAIAPEDLAASSPMDAERRALPAFALYAALRQEAHGLDAFLWGPTGSTGFELVSGLPVVTATSDLDLLIRTPRPLPRERAVQILSDLDSHARRAGIRVDVQLDTPTGGVALTEWAAGKARVMVRHAQGPRLLADPWAVLTTLHA